MAPDRIEWLSLGIAALWLCVMMLYARARDAKEAYQLRRVPLAAGSFAAGLALNDLVLAALLGRLDIIWFHVILGIAILFGMLAFSSALLFDVAAVLLLDATRRPLWLVAGVVAAVLMFYAWLFFVGGALWGAVPGTGSPAFFAPGLLAAAGGIVWWSGLPRHPDDDEAGIFD